MKQTNNSLVFAVIFLSVALLGAIGYKKYQPRPQPPVARREAPPVRVRPEPPKTPRIPNVSIKIPSYLDYGGVTQQCQKWAQEAPDLAEYGTYGKTRRGTDICYLRVCNKLDTKSKPKVMITGCIHGNEPWATGCVMAFCGTLLGEYGKNPEITELVNSRDIYIVPVISPDSYPHSRHVDGVDPNRDFPGPSRPNHQSTPSIAAIQTFFLKVRPNAIISGHTHGRIFLTPYGDQYQRCPNDADFQRIVGQMGQLAQYRVDRACNMYGTPMHGSEVDWYYRHGAFSNSPNGKIHRGAFSVVCEFGTHQRIPTKNEIEEEFNRTYRGFLYFCKEAPLVEIWWDEHGNPVNPDGTPKRITSSCLPTIYRSVILDRRPNMLDVFKPHPKLGSVIAKNFGSGRFLTSIEINDYIARRQSVQEIGDLQIGHPLSRLEPHILDTIPCLGTTSD